MVNLHTVNPSFFNMAAGSLATQWNKDAVMVELRRPKFLKKNSHIMELAQSGSWSRWNPCYVGVYG